MNNTKQKSRLSTGFFIFAPCWTRTNDAYGQKHSRLAWGTPKYSHFLGERTRCVIMSFRQRRKRVIWSHRGRGARRNARCFFLLIAPLHLPQAARCSEPVNSRCGCVWQGRRFGSASKVKKSRKILALLLCQLNKIHLVQWFFNKWSVYSANMKQQLRCNEVLAMLTWSKAHLLFFMRLNALH